MEFNEISMFMDAKLDIHDKKPEAIKLRTWTKCLVKIEAIKCFPCYLRITFIRNIEDESANLCVRINIPGITIRLASSRTKTYSYGIFWKHNRKRCCIFFAFDTQLSCERHMKWLKTSLKNLELHRQEIFETRRISRGNSTIIDLTKTLDMSSFIHFNDANDKRNLQDILGPLPKIPDIRESGNWSRRISGASDIYEEIPDARRDSRRISRASGIYEEMRAPINIDLFRIKKTSEILPPPLPPRKRINTYQTDNIIEDSIPRCNTNPESDMIRKKNCLQVFENVFIGKSQRSESVSEGTVSNCEELIDTINTPDKAALTLQLYSNEVTPRSKRKFPYIFNNKNKRNSFSSPDLSKINPFDEFETIDDYNSISSEFQIFNDCSASAENITTPVITISSPLPTTNSDINKTITNNDIEKESILNISEQITSNFNLSLNSSTNNLVGCNLNPVFPTNNNDNNKINNILIEDLSGYCTMAPIIQKLRLKKLTTTSINSINNKSSSNNDETIIINNDSDKENDDDVFKPPICIKNPIVNNVEQKIYENLKSIENKNVNIYENLKQQQPDLISQISDESNQSFSPSNEQNHDEQNLEKHHNQEEEEDYYKTPRKSIISIDEKIPSYYPNSCDTKKCQRRQRTNSNSHITNNHDLFSIRHLASAKLTHSENLYISSPQKILEQRRNAGNNKLFNNCNKITDKLNPPLKACKISDNIYSVKRSIITNNDDYNENLSSEEDDFIETIESDKSIVATISFGAIQNIDFTFDDSNLKRIDGTIINSSSSRLELKKKIANKQIKCNNINTNSDSLTTQRIYQKYSATTRVTSANKLTDNNSGGVTNNVNSKIKTTPNSSTDISTIKKFASLPRFKKIDFSPLKIKINNVLQRHQSDGL